MRILFIGDIVGQCGRQFVCEQVPLLRQSLGLDFIVANGENAAAGSGITTKIANELIAAGVDAVTLGDHVWDQRGFADQIDGLEKVCRPANLPRDNPGRPFLVVENAAGLRLGIFTVLGRTFMKTLTDCPFRTADAVLEVLAPQCDAVLAEAHAETTAEKVALGWYLDGRAALIVGTHTHIPTADATILPRGSGYHTDAGMSGPYQSVLGREIEPILGRFLDGLPRRWPVAEGDVRLCGTLVDFDLEARAATRCEQLTISKDALAVASAASTDG